MKNNYYFIKAKMTISEVQEYKFIAPQVDEYIEDTPFTIRDVIQDVITGYYYNGFEGYLQVLENKNGYFKLEILGTDGYYTIEATEIDE